MKYVMGWDVPLRAVGIVIGGVLLIGCNSSQSTPITSQTSKYEVAESSAPATNGTETAPVAPVAPPADTGSPAAEPAAATTPAVEPPKPSSTPPVAVQNTTQTSATIDRTNPQQMADYLDELLNRQPRGASREEAMMRYEATQNEVLEIATALLELNASDEMKQRAAEAKIQAFTILSQLGRKQAEEEMKIFLAQLARSENAELARLGKRMVFAQRMDTIARGDASDVGTLAKELETLLADEKKDMPLFALSTQVARIMMERGTREDALNVMKMTQRTFQDSTDPKIAAQARALAEEVTMVELDLNSKLVSFIQGEKNAEKALFDAVQTLLSSPSVGATSLSIVMQIAQVLESRDLEATARLHEMSRIAFEKHADADLAKQAVSSAESFGKRKAIIGRPFTVQGTTLDGRPFDWSAYQGKVVLVDFWATWCGPCLQEMPNIRMNYEQYHDRGFEVVGINLDDNVQAVEQFFSVQKLPWTTVLSPDPNQTGFEHPLAVECGVEFIPFIVLIGRDGKAMALNVRGEELGKRLAELFPDAPATTPPATPAKAAAKTSSFRPQRAGRPSLAFVGLSTGSRHTDGLGLAVPSDGTRSTERPAAETFRALSPPVELALLGSGPADETTTDETTTDETTTGETTTGETAEGRDANPYLAAADLDANQLTTFLLDMQDKPQSIQSRPGFAAALVDAADRILAASPTAPQRRTAVLTKFAALLRIADSGDPAADRKLVELADQFQEDPSTEIAAEVTLVRTQDAALAAANLPLDKLPAALSALREELAKQKLTERHLRTASAVVEAINRLGDDDFREARFAEFGALFAKSDNRELARYGQRLAPPSAEGLAEWIGKPIELAGTTLLGEPFDWTRLRGHVVVVQVWASWCGPCREELPRLKELHGRLAGQGLEVVGVSVDKDTEAAAKFLEEHPLPWATLVGQDALDFARRLGIRGIPTLLLVDPQGRVVAHANQVAKLADKAASLLASSGG